jgi:replicative DNA helicase
MNIQANLAEAEECGALYAITMGDENSQSLCMRLRAEYFSDPHRRMAYEAARALYETGKYVNLMSIIDYLKSTQKITIQDISKIAIYDFQGVDRYRHLSMANHYGEVLHKAYINREAMQCVRHYVDELSLSDPYQASLQLIAKIEILAQTVETDDFVQISRKAIEQAEKIRQISTGEFVQDYCKTFVPTLDKIIGGFFPKQYITLAARPGQGKSLLALQIALNMASRQIPVAYVTLEMSTEEQVNRCLSNRTGIATALIKRAKDLNAQQMHDLQKAAYDFNNMPLYFNDDPIIDVSKLDGYIRELKKKGIKGIFVDMIQLLQPMTGDKSKQKTEQITNISKSLKALAKRHEIWIVNIAAMNRDVEKSNRRPKISDIRESGQIESDSDLVLMIYRPNYDADKPPIEDASEEIELIIGKNRDGGTGTVSILAQWHLCKFAEVDRFHDTKQFIPTSKSPF